VAPPQPKDLEAGGTSPPFYRTRKGMIIIAVVALVVIIVVAVGGSVGGKKKNMTYQSGSTQTSTEAPFQTAASLGSGIPDPTTTGTATTTRSGRTSAEPASTQTSEGPFQSGAPGD